MRNKETIEEKQNIMKGKQYVKGDKITVKRQGEISRGIFIKLLNNKVRYVKIINKYGKYLSAMCHINSITKENKMPERSLGQQMNSLKSTKVFFIDNGGNINSGTIRYVDYSADIISIDVKGSNYNIKITDESVFETAEEMCCKFLGNKGWTVFKKGKTADLFKNLKK